jgi:hypothetical protein
VTPDRRATFAALADVLVPGDGAMPRAGEVDVAGRLLDRVLRADPGLGRALAVLLDELDGEPAEEAVRQLERQRPASLDLLLLAAGGAYLLDERVRDLLGYHGQEAETLPRGGFGGEEFLEAVVGRGPRWRESPT